MSNRDFWNRVNGQSDRESWIEDDKAFIEESFEDSVFYVEYYKNNDFDHSYGGLLEDNIAWNKPVTSKKFTVYPNDNVNNGDYIHCPYDGVMTTWLVKSADKALRHKIRCEILKTNNQLKFIDNNGVLQTFACVIDDGFGGTDLDINRQLDIAQGQIVVRAQYNNATKEIGAGYRFILGPQSWSVAFLRDYMNDGIITLVLVKDEKQNDDDIINGIADTSKHNYNANQVVLNGNVITPAVRSIKEGDTQTYTVRKYVSGLVQNDEFSVAAEGVPEENYELITISANQFSLKNNAMYKPSQLRLTCTNLTDSSTVVLKVSLIGGW